jgi:hypothetical protein
VGQDRAIDELLLRISAIVITRIGIVIAGLARWVGAKRRPGCFVFNYGRVAARAYQNNIPTIKNAFFRRTAHKTADTPSLPKRPRTRTQPADWFDVQLPFTKKDVYGLGVPYFIRVLFDGPVGGKLAHAGHV